MHPDSSIRHRISRGAWIPALLVLFGGPLGAQEQPAFRPLIADPREVGSSVAYLSWSQPELQARVVAVGIGDEFKLFRRSGGNQTIEAAVGSVVLAQFNGSKRSFDFVNADFIVGLPLSWRRGEWSARGRLFHWSSHLGDEFLLTTEIERFEVSLGALELLAAHDHRYGRIYGGGELWFARVPSRLPTWVAHAGAELQAGPGTRWLPELGARGIAAVDVRAADFGPQRVGVSVRSGLEFGTRRPWGIFGDFYDGPSPHGQFFDRALRYWGLTIRLTL